MKHIEIFGANCGRCKAMNKCVHVPTNPIGVECEIVKVTDPMKFIDYAIPTLVIDDKVFVCGPVCS